MKKKIIIIVSIVAALLIALAVTLSVVLHKSYLQKTKYDHISSVDYNGVRIVGKDGLFYLEKDKTILSNGYVSLYSVNDAYAQEGETWKTASDTVLFDYYIARRSEFAQYVLLTVQGEEYVLLGDNYSLDRICLPYLIFINNTTGRYTAISLKKLNSDLSSQSGKELSMHSFTDLTPIRYQKDTVLYSHLEAQDVSLSQTHSIFSQDGTLLVSGSSVEKIYLNDTASDRTAVYFSNTDTKAVYTAKGEKIAVGTALLNRVSPSFGWFPCLLEDKTAGIAVLSTQTNFTIPLKNSDLSCLQIFDGSVALSHKPENEESGEIIELYAASTGNSFVCQSIENPVDGILKITAPNQTDCFYYSENAVFLMQSPYSDMVLQTELSSESSLVFVSDAYNTDHENGNFLHFAKENTPAAIAKLDENTTIEPLYANNGTVPVDGSFLLREIKNEKTTYRLLTPFSLRLFGDSFESLDVFYQANIYWMRAAHYTQEAYYVVDPIANQILYTIPCTKEQFSLFEFDFVGCDSLLADPSDQKSSVPILILRLSAWKEDANLTTSVRYFALYRSIPYSAPSFHEGTLRILEIGKNLLISSPYAFFPESNLLVAHNTDSSYVYRLNDSHILSSVISLPYNVSRIISDVQNPDLYYFVVQTESQKEGLYAVDGTQILPPYYDRVISALDQKFVVSLRGAQGVLEYKKGKIKPLLDYCYSNIIPLSDNGFLATDGNQKTYLFEGNNEIFTEPIQSTETIFSYFMNEEGKLVYRCDTIFSVDGKLYLHHSDHILTPRIHQFERAQTDFTDVRNQRAVTVRYYQNDQLLYSDVIFPTEDFQNAFFFFDSPLKNGWALRNAPSTKISKSDLLVLGKHVIELVPFEE